MFKEKDEEDSVEGCREVDEEVLGLGMESMLFKEKEEDAVEGCLEDEEEVLGLGIPSTRAAATEPPIWNILWASRPMVAC